MATAKARPRKSTVKRHLATPDDLYPKKPESLLRQLLRRPPRRSGGDPG